MQPALPLNDVRRLARLIRRDVLVQTYAANSGHPGGPFSAADYLAVLWFRHLRIDPQNPQWRERDRFVLSNGHCSALLYSLLARRGFIPFSSLVTFRATGSPLQGHPNRLKVSGVEASTGSLGQGFPVAHGMALGAKLAKLESVRVICNLGDGELQEGIMWETAMAAAHYRTDNLLAMVDFNNAQIDGYVSDIMEVEPLADKFRSFRWRVIEANGHDYEAIESAYQQAFMPDPRPTVILFRTRMMAGAPTFENDPGWHGKPLNRDQMAVALRELGFDSDADALVERYRRGDAEA
ncbi:MAG: transketolase [Myxococcales bacterium]|nr:MAG: transketolase [Myxococcales bacterium]